MRKKCHISHPLLSAVFGLLFAIFAAFTPLSNPINTPVYAVPEATEKQPTVTEGTEESNEPEQPVNASGDNCVNQTGAVGWLICPTTGLIANAADALYSIIENFLVVDPISFNSESPVFSIWDYCRSITNIVFIILILVVILSQVTGIGFNNYNIKKTLPRIIIAAILINLSFILCGLAVDLSNIIGANLSDFFNGITENAIANAGYDPALYNLGNIVTAIIGGGAIAGVTITVVASGGVAAFFWMLVPVLLGAIVSIVTGLLTISARQAVIILLVMISPLAIVANTLPNTEKWFTKWKTIFFQMLVFYPTFSFLFGASRLVGLIFITSATNIYGVILGVAVQVFPLFFSWQLMKMSGTALGMLSTRINAIGQRGVAASRGWSNSHRELARARHTATSRMPSASFNRWMQDRQARRELDTAAYKQRSANRAAANAYNPYDRNGQLTKRGERLYAMQAGTMRDATRLKQYKAEFEEQGYGHDGSDKRVRTKSLARIKEANEAIVREVDRGHYADSFLESAKTANALSYADRVNKRREEITEIQRSNMSQAEKERAITAVDKDLASMLSVVTDSKQHSQYRSNVFANAISAQARADKTVHDDYASLYANTKKTRDIDLEFQKSFSERNYSAMEAAIDEMAKRGDFDLIEKALFTHSGEISDNLEMQKHLADTLIKYKGDSAPLWAYAKALNVRRGKAANGANVADFITFQDFFTGASPSHCANTESREETDKLTMTTLVKEINNPSIAISQDRTTFGYILEAQQEGQLQPNQLGFQIKQLRSAASSGQMDGEQLGNLNKLLTGGLVFDGKTGALDTKKSKQKSIDYVEANKDAVRANIIDYIENMSAAQLAAMKESTFIALNGALSYLDGESGDTSTGVPGGLSTAFRDAIYKNAAGNMNGIIVSSMNTNIKKWLGIASNKH